MPSKLIVILGPTAVGKTHFAVKLAMKFNGEIISADSRQVYKFMDIGTGKDLNEYKIDNKTIPYHLIDFVSPLEEYNLFRFVNDFNESFDKIISRGNLPFLVGGSAMYINAVIQNYNLPKVDFDLGMEKYSNHTDEELKEILLRRKNRLHNKTDLTSRERLIRAIIISEMNDLSKIQSPKFDYLVVGVSEDRNLLKQKIEKRLKERLQNGMIDEAKNLVKIGVSLDKLKYFGLEYKYLAEFIEGKLNYNDMYQKLRSAIFDFSKRQMTWFRKMEHEGINIHWVNPSELHIAENIIANFLKYE